MKTTRPFFFDETDATSGLRFFGAPPQGVLPVQDSMRYLLTAPYGNGSSEISVFIHEDPDAVLEGMHVIQRPGSRLIEVVAHAPSPRGPSTSLALGDMGYAGRALNPITDLRDGERYSAHKLGGMPHFLHGEPEVELPIAEAIHRSGFVQVIQVGLPAYEEDADIDYDWPFSDGLMHLVAKLDGDRLDWLMLWG